MHGNTLGDQIARLQSGHAFALPKDSDDQALVELVVALTAQEPRLRPPTAARALQMLNDGASTEPLRGRPRRAESQERTPKHVQLVAVAAIGLGMVLAYFFATSSDEVVAGKAATSRDAPASLAARTSDPSPSSKPPLPEQPDLGTGPIELNGCGIDPPFVGDLRAMPSLDGLDVGELVYIPKSYSPATPAPLLVVVHDGGIDAGANFHQSGLMEAAEKHGFVVLAPSGSANTANERAALGVVRTAIFDAWTQEGVDAWLTDLVRDTTERLCIARDRIFLLGSGYHRTGRSAAQLPTMGVRFRHPRQRVQRRRRYADLALCKRRSCAHLFWHVEQGEPAPVAAETAAADLGCPTTSCAPCGARGSDATRTRKSCWTRKTTCATRGRVRRPACCTPATFRQATVGQECSASGTPARSAPNEPPSSHWGPTPWSSSRICRRGHETSVRLLLRPSTKTACAASPTRREPAPTVTRSMTLDE